MFLMAESHLYQLKKKGDLWQPEHPVGEINFSLVMAFQNFSKGWYAVEWWPPEHFGQIKSSTNDIMETDMNQWISIMNAEFSFSWMPLLRLCQ